MPEADVPPLGALCLAGLLTYRFSDAVADRRHGRPGHRFFLYGRSSTAAHLFALVIRFLLHPLTRSPAVRERVRSPWIRPRRPGA